MNAQPMTWTGLHVPQRQRPSTSAPRVTEAPCSACTVEQQRACRAGLTCTAFLRYVHATSWRTVVDRDPEAEPALAQLAPLLDVDVPVADKEASRALMERAARIVGQALGLPPSAQHSTATAPGAGCSRCVTDIQNG